jgi:hypothetical protein
LEVGEKEMSKSPLAYNVLRAEEVKAATKVHRKNEILGITRLRRHKAPDVQVSVYEPPKQPIGK